MLHAKVNAVVLLRFVNEEIFQRIVAVGWGKRFFADLAVNRTCRMWQLRPHANELISRCALRTKEIGSFEITVVTDGMARFKLPDNIVANANREEVNAALVAAHREPDVFATP